NRAKRFDAEPCASRGFPPKSPRLLVVLGRPFTPVTWVRIPPGTLRFHRRTPELQPPVYESCTRWCEHRNANAVCERFLRSVRAECLNHWSSGARRIFDPPSAATEAARPHQSIGQKEGAAWLAQREWLRWASIRGTRSPRPRRTSTQSSRHPDAGNSGRLCSHVHSSGPRRWKPGCGSVRGGSACGTTTIRSGKGK